MSLRAFHIIFIIVTVILSLYVSLWGVREFTQDRSGIGLTMAVLFFVTAIAGVIYGKKAFTKLKELP